jgi:predicted lipid-binding transport protein (Tim44 family)
MDKPPYPWKSVLLWTAIVFVVFFITARPPVDGNTGVAFKFGFALVYSVIAFVIVGIYRYFRRPAATAEVPQPHASQQDSHVSHNNPESPHQAKPEPTPPPQPRPFAGFQDIPEQPHKSEKPNLKLPRGKE